MPNWCDISIHTVIKDKHQANDCYWWLENARVEADKKGEGFQLGNAKQWVFDGEVTLDSHDVSIYGLIKWGWEDNAPEDFVESMLDKGWAVQSVECEFHEDGNLYHGKWSYDGGTGVLEIRVLKDSYVSKFYEERTEEELDAGDYYDKLLEYVEAAPDDQYETWTTQIKEVSE